MYITTLETSQLDKVGKLQALHLLNEELELLRMHALAGSTERARLKSRILTVWKRQANAKVSTDELIMFLREKLNG